MIRTTTMSLPNLILETEMKNPDEDYAYGQWKQKQIDSSNLIGRALKNAEKVPKFERVDPWKDIPFAEEAPPTDGLLMLWSVCTALALLLSTYLIWGAK